MKNRKLVIRLDDQLFAALAARREETGVSVSEFLRRAARSALFADARVQEKLGFGVGDAR